MFDELICEDAAGQRGPGCFCLLPPCGASDGLPAVLTVAGPAGSGKTAFLIDIAKQLVDNGVEPSRILFAAVSPDACAAVRARLAQRDGRLAAVCVATPDDEVDRVLATPSARARLGREPRFLLPPEANMLFEDLKHGVVVETRLLRGLYGDVCGCVARGEEPGCKERGEAWRALYGRIRSWLDFTGGTLREEAAPLAVRVLSDAGGDARPARYDAVLVDDAHGLAVAYGRMFALLCGMGEAVDPGCGEVRRRCVDLGGKPAPCGAFAEGEGVVAIKWREPADEFDGLARIVRRFAGRGVVSDGSDVVVAAPTRAWALGMARALERRDVPVTVCTDGDLVRGDPRDLVASGNLGALAALSLAADPRDAVAWRLWLGLGDRHVRSGAWLAFEGWARGRGLGAVEALEELARVVETPGDGSGAAAAGEPFAGAACLCARYREGLRAVKRLRCRKGFALAKAASTGAASAFGSAFGALEGEETPAELLKCLRRQINAPSFVPGDRNVKVVPYGRLAGLSPRVLVMGGLVEGLMPAGPRAPRVAAARSGEGHGRAAARAERDRAAFFDAAAKARETLYLSFPQRADLEFARRAGMDVRRTRVEPDRTTAVLTRSCLLDEMGDDCPPVLSGEQYLAALAAAPEASADS